MASNPVSRSQAYSGSRECPAGVRPASSAHDDFADLDHRSLVSVVWDIPHDLLRVRPKAGLKGLDRIAEDVAHANVCRWCSRGSTSEALVNCVVLAGIA